MRSEPIVSLAQPHELPAIRALIIAGLTQRWRIYADAANPDLQSFERTYASASIIVAKLQVEIVGCGILIEETTGVGRIVRMSVAGDRQRAGIGGHVLRALLDRAVQLGYARVVLETSADWHSAVSFYEQHGFVRTEQRDGDLHFTFDLRDRFRVD